MSDDRRYDQQGRPPIGLPYSYDVDAAQHFLGDHAADVIVAFDHHAVNPEVSIYVETLTAPFLLATTISGRCFTRRRPASRLKLQRFDAIVRDACAGTTTG